MREPPGGAWTCPPRLLARAGLLTRNMLVTSLVTATVRATGRNAGVRNTGWAARVRATGRASTHRASTRLATTGLVMVGGLLVAGCGQAAPATFRPAGAGAAAPGPDASPADPASPGHPANSGSGTAGPLRWPPFGANVHIVMPGWRPADPGEVPAVIAAKDFLLAFLYAEYRGNQDDRWTGYVSGPVLSALKANLSEPSVTTESFTGTIIFSHMRAYPDPATAGAVDVSECFDNAGSRNTDLVTGKDIPDRTPANQHYYMNTDVMARVNRQWRVISVYPVIYYPQARECKP